MANKGASYYSSHVEPDINDEPHVYRGADGRDDATIEGYTAQVVGGGTQLYGGVSLRFTPRDLTLAQCNNSSGRRSRWRPNGDVLREARDWPFDYATLEPYYAMAEDLVGINGEGQSAEAVHERRSISAAARHNPISEYMQTA